MVRLGLNMADVVLIAVNNDDIASSNQAKHLLALHPWSKDNDVESYSAYSYEMYECGSYQAVFYGKTISICVGIKRRLKQ